MTIAHGDPARPRVGAIGDDAGSGGLGLGHDDGELVAADAREQVRAAHGAGQVRRDVDQDLIAGLVAEGVVDGLELVDVDEGQRERSAVPLGPPTSLRRRS